MDFDNTKIPFKRHDVFNFFASLDLTITPTRYWYCYTSSGGRHPNYFVIYFKAGRFKFLCLQL